MSTTEQLDDQFYPPAVSELLRAAENAESIIRARAIAFEEERYEGPQDDWRIAPIESAEQLALYDQVVLRLRTARRQFVVDVVPLYRAAPDLLAFARRTLPMMVAERDCLYDGETDHNGEYRDDEGREAVEQLDREIAELRALIARAEGGAE